MKKKFQTSKEVAMAFCAVFSGLSLQAQFQWPEPIPSVAFQYRTLQSDFKMLDTAFRPELYGGFAFDESTSRLRLEAGNLGAPVFEPIYNPMYHAYLHWGNYPFYHNRVRQEQVLFFKVTAPLTEARYLQGYNRGQLFRIFHTQNIHSRWNFNLHWQRLNSEGFYPHMNTERSNFTISTDYCSPDKRYVFTGYYTYQRQLSNENGGLRFDTVFTQNTRRDRPLVPVKFREGRSVSSIQEAYFQHRYSLISAISDSDETGRKYSSVTGIGHRMYYSGEKYQYIKSHRPDDTLYFRDFYYSFEKTDDSTAFIFFRNEAFLFAELSKNAYAEAGAGFQHSLHGGRFHSRYFSQFRLYGDVSWKLNRLLLTAGISHHPVGEASGTSSLQAAASIFWFKHYSAKAYIKNSVEAPHTFFVLHLSNLTAWNRTFSYIRYREMGGTVELPIVGTLEAKAWINQGLLFIGDDLRPVQHQGPISIAQFQWRTEYRPAKFLTYRHRITNQQISDREVLRLPQWAAEADVFAKFSLFRGNLSVIAGVGGMYVSRFKAMGYTPVLGTFYLANSGLIGNTFIADAFMHFQIKNAVITVRYENATAGWLTPFNYFAAAGYPVADPFLRVGILWRFFN
ncbi:putative porin [Schleiferia thermophila]|uniref:putative porin n=1 Tax=Schleiferia thermophila TaxID=884107 RepID=UPI003F500950